LEYVVFEHDMVDPQATVKLCALVLTVLFTVTVVFVEIKNLTVRVRAVNVQMYLYMVIPHSSYFIFLDHEALE
jgi:hypothetical protein